MVKIVIYIGLVSSILNHSFNWVFNW